MKKLLVALCLTCILTLAVHAEDTNKVSGKVKKHLTTEQQTVMDQMLQKYDINKDGKLDKDEVAKMSAEDKANWDKTFPHKKKGEAKPATEKPAADKPAGDAKP